MIELLEVQSRARNAKRATVQMLTHPTAPVPTTTAGEDLVRRLLVPVDASTASFKAVDLAIRLAQMQQAEVLLVALLPDPKPDEVDPDVFNALWMQSELGMGVPIYVPEPDEQTRVQSRYESVLLPLQRRAAAAGVAAEMRLLRGPGLQGQFRRLLYADEGRTAVVLCNPLKLYGPLRELTSTLWAEPQCTTYVAGLDAAPVRPGAVVRSLLRRLFGVRKQDKIAHAAPSYGTAAR